MKEKNCRYCGKKLRFKRRGAKRKFCNITCRSRYDSRLYYIQHKDNPEFKKSRKEYFNKWRKLNREKFNAYIRKYYKKNRLLNSKSTPLEQSSL